MNAYDLRTRGEGQGTVHGPGNPGRKMEGKKVSEFLPNEVKVSKYKCAGEIQKFKYPQSAEAIYDEQEGDVRTATRDRASMKRLK